MPKPAEQLKPMPQFRSHDEAGEFWMPHDTTEYIDWSQAQKVRFTTLRPGVYRRLVPSAALTKQRKPMGPAERLRGRRVSAVAADGLHPVTLLRLLRTHS